jgi:putative membrane protein
MSEKGIFRLVMIISVVVVALVVVLNRKVLPVPAETPAFVPWQPVLHAFINGTCSILLICSYIAIRRKKITVHKRLNVTAFFLSALFIVSYVTYHYLVKHETLYGDLDHNGVVSDAEKATAGFMRPVYLTILTSHILLAAVVFPLILLSFYHGLKNNVVKHRKLTRFSFPIWLYVTVTGVVVYLMIHPYYAF